MTILFFSLWFLMTMVTPETTQNTIDTSTPVTPAGYLISSEDGGNHWRDHSTGIPENTMPGSFMVWDETFYLGTMAGLYTGSATLPQANWRKELAPEKEVTGIFQGKNGPYASSQWKGFYQQMQAGQWTPMHGNLKDKTIYAVIESGEGKLYIGSQTGIYESADHGKTWHHVHNSGAVIQMEESHSVLFACTGNMLLRSTDGKNWQQTMGNDKFPFTISRMSEGLVSIANGPEFAGYRPAKEVMLSKDNGLTWKPMFKSLPASLQSVNDIAQVGETIFASSPGGIFRSTVNGEKWEQVVVLPDDNKGSFYKLFVNGTQLYALRMQGC